MYQIGVRKIFWTLIDFYSQQNMKIWQLKSQCISPIPNVFPPHMHLHAENCIKTCFCKNFFPRQLGFSDLGSDG